MQLILDYDALFDEGGRQANVCTRTDLGGCYSHKRETAQLNQTQPILPIDGLYPNCDADGKGKMPEYRRFPRVKGRLRAVRYPDFGRSDTDRRGKTLSPLDSLLLLLSGVTVLVAIAAQL